MATTRIVDAIVKASREAEAEAAARNVIAGHPQGSVRRIILYTLAFALCVTPVAPLAVVPLALLIATDSIL